MEDSAEGNSDGSKIKRWHFNYRTLIKARGWWLWTRPPLIVPPDVLIKWDRVGGGNNSNKKKVTGPTQSRDAARWEFGNMDVPDRQKWRRMSKQSALNIPGRGPARWDPGAAGLPSLHPRQIISIGHGQRGHRSSDATENRQPREGWMRGGGDPDLHLTQIKSVTQMTLGQLKWFLRAVKAVSFFKRGRGLWRHTTGQDTSFTFFWKIWFFWFKITVVDC